MFNFEDIVSLKQKSEDENKSLKICMGYNSVIIEPEDSVNILKSNPTLIKLQNSLDISCNQTIIDMDSITHIHLLNL